MLFHSIRHPILTACYVFIIFLLQFLLYEFESICHILCARRHGVFLPVYENEWKRDPAKDTWRSNKIVVIVHSFRTNHVWLKFWWMSFWCSHFDSRSSISYRLLFQWCNTRDNGNWLVLRFFFLTMAQSGRAGVCIIKSKLPESKNSS